MISLKAWAKVNIGLKILGKREDGFHNIETTMTTINLADIIQFEKTEAGISLDAPSLDLPVAENLCYRAAELFFKRFEIKQGVHMKLIKNIPVGGGLGGGSSDAACVLNGLAQLFGLSASYEELFVLSKELGSDVPFFLKGGAAYVRGRGDELKYFKLPRMSLVIYYPGYPISTKWAYEEYDRMALTPQPEMNRITEEPGKKKKKKRIDFKIQNDFEKVVFNKHPDLLDIKTQLLAAGAFLISLSGSGSCLFTVVDEGIRKKVIKFLDGIGAKYFEVKTIDF